MPTCYICKKTKPAVEFALKYGATRNTSCKACKREYNKIWYQKNKKRHIAAVTQNNRKYRTELREWLTELKNRPCQDCGQRYPAYVMDFDHRDGSQKDDAISRMVTQRVLRKEIEKEIKKCDLVCSNCHRERTYQRQVRELEPKRSSKPRSR